VEIGVQGTGSDPEFKLLLSYAQTAEALGLSQRTVRALVYGGQLRAVRVGTRRLIAVDDLRAFVSSLREPSPR
jgi:excisionase family DNA binding protein